MTSSPPPRGTEASRKVRIRCKRVTLHHAPFELDIAVKDGEELEEALERCFGSIALEAELLAEATDLLDYEVLP